MNVNFPHRLGMHRLGPEMFAALFWVLGLVLGTLFSAGPDASLLIWMRSLLTGRMSIVFMLVFAVLPFLISAYAVFIHRQEILCGVCFCKAFCLAANGVLLQSAFGSAGWLLQPMFQFSDLLLAPVFCWFFLGSYGMTERDVLRRHGICLAWVLAAVLIGYFVVMPFGADLIFHSSGR